MQQPFLQPLSSSSSQWSKAILRRQTFARKTIAYCMSQNGLFYSPAGGDMPELVNIATGRQTRPVQLDKIAAVFSIAGQK
jgi:hypothetical protein